MKYGKGRCQEWVEESESVLATVVNGTLERVIVHKVTIGSKQKGKAIPLQAWTGP
jgi:hypothetical protein